MRVGSLARESRVLLRGQLVNCVARRSVLPSEFHQGSVNTAQKRLGLFESLHQRRGPASFTRWRASYFTLTRLHYGGAMKLTTALPVLDTLFNSSSFATAVTTFVC